MKNSALGVALKRALRNVNGEGSLSSQVSVGFILEPGKKGEREGVQVFVRAIRFSEKKLADLPDTGGLLAKL